MVLCLLNIGIVLLMMMIISSSIIISIMLLGVVPKNMMMILLIWIITRYTFITNDDTMMTMAMLLEYHPNSCASKGEGFDTTTLQCVSCQSPLIPNTLSLSPPCICPTSHIR